MDPISNQLNSLWVQDPNSPDIFSFLAEYADVEERDFVAAILLDQKYRWKQKSPYSVENYLAGIVPRQLSKQSQIDLILSEFRVRELRPTAENLLEYLTRFEHFRKELSVHFSAMARAKQTLTELSLQLDDLSEVPLSNKSSVLKAESESPSPKVRYELQKVLGEGAFGKVYQGYDHDLERFVAIKFPNDKRLKDKKHREQYLSEARTVASLNHPNIVPVYDIVRREDEAIYIVSKFIAGCTLEDRTSTSQPSFAETCNIMISIANALDHAHHNDIVHRDVKPGNILLETNTGIAYITDFGLAIKGEHTELQGRISGTPPYMSPEQVRGENHKLDGRSDVFSLGAILYELLTGVRAFAGDTTQDIFRQVLESNPTKPQLLNQSIPGELERICLKALSKQSSQRYSTAAAMAADLAKWARTVKFQTLDHEQDGSFISQHSFNDTLVERDAATFASQGLLVNPNREKPTSGKLASKLRGTKKLWNSKPLAFGAIVALVVSAVAVVFWGGIPGLESELTVVEFETIPSATTVVIRNDRMHQQLTPEDRGRTLSIAPGEYQIEISAEGYEKIKETLNVSVRKSEGDDGLSSKQLQRYELKPQLIPVRFATSPENVNVFRDDQPVPFDSGKKAYLLYPGDVVLRFESEGYLPLVHRVTVESNLSSIRIPELKIPVLLKSNVLGAEFFLDNQKLKPIDNQQDTYAIPSGEHLLRCELDGYSMLKKSITVSVENRQFVFSLVPSGTVVKFVPWIDGIKVFQSGKEVKWNSDVSGHIFQPGDYEISLERPGYAPQPVHLRVSDQSQEFLLEPWKLESWFQANVPNTSYWIDQKELVSIDPKETKFALSEGTYVVTAKANGFKSLDQTVRVNPDSLIHQFELKVDDAISTIPDDLYANGKIVVRVTPASRGKLDLKLEGKSITLQDGLGQVDPSDLDSRKSTWPFSLQINEERSLTGVFTRKQLEEYGSRPTLDITIPLTKEEQARRIWLLNRPYLTSDPAGVELALTQAIELSPEQYEIYRDRASCRVELEKYVEADEDIEICLNHIPNDYLVQCIASWIAIGKGDFEIARTRLARANEILPNSTTATLLNARLSFREKDFMAAKEFLKQLISSSGSDHQLAYGKTILAQIAFEENNYSESIALFDEAILDQRQAGLKTAEISFNRVQAMVRQSKKLAAQNEPKSRSLLEEARDSLVSIEFEIDESEPLFIRSRLSLAEIEFELENYKNALDIYSFLIDDLQLQDAKILEKRANVYDKLEDRGSANRDRQNAERLKKSE